MPKRWLVVHTVKTCKNCGFRYRPASGYSNHCSVGCRTRFRRKRERSPNHHKVAKKYHNNRMKEPTYRAYMKKKWKMHHQKLGSRYQAYIRGARMRNLKFEITLEQFDELTQLPCYYCGKTPNGVYNGLDRINNDIGYLIENVVPCCKKDNMMKHAFSSKEYFEQIIAVAKHHKLL